VRAVATCESCSLDIFTTGEPSRSFHGEGQVRQVLIGPASCRVPPGYGDRHTLKVWVGTGETRLRSLVSKDRLL